MMDEGQELESERRAYVAEQMAEAGPDDDGRIGPCPPDVPYEDWIAYCVAQAPPIPPEAIERLARLFLSPAPLDAVRTEEDNHGTA